jgi:hypothetical protein
MNLNVEKIGLVFAQNLSCKSTPGVDFMKQFMPYT